MSGSSSAAVPEVESFTDDELQILYHVILLNDEDHTYDYVLEMLQKLFGFSAPENVSVSPRRRERSA